MLRVASLPSTHIRILEISVFRFYKEKWYGLLNEGVGKNCFYRFLTNASYNWRSLLFGVAKQFLRIVEKRGGESNDMPDFYIVDDTTLEKPQVALQVVRRSWKRCIRAAYFLADSWFDGIDFIKDLREIAGGALHVICMAKNGTRKYDYNGHKHAGKELMAMNERHAKTCRQYKCRYFKVDVTFEGVELRQFFIQYYYCPLNISLMEKFRADTESGISPHLSSPDMGII